MCVQQKPEPELRGGTDWNRTGSATLFFELVKTIKNEGEFISWGYRRRTKTEEKAKVVAAVWETELIQFLAALDIFHQNDFEEKDEWQKGCLKKFMIIRCTPYQTTTLPKGCSQKKIHLNHPRQSSMPLNQTTATTLAFSSVFILLLLCLYGTYSKP